MTNLSVPKTDNTTDLAPINPAPAPVAQPLLTAAQIQLLADTIAKGATPDELKLFSEVCKRKNLDPFSRQIHAIKIWDTTLKRMVMTFQVGIDGFRLIAERTGRYEGQDGPFWCGRDGKWFDVWLDAHPPAAARVGVFRRGFTKPIYAVAHYPEYVQFNREGQPNSMWKKMPANQLAKCCEALALRKAFPEELSGLYAPEEMGRSEEAQPPGPPAPMEDLSNVPDPVKMMWSAMRDIKSVCDVFAVLKAQMTQEMGPAGEAEYYRILRETAGVKHANELRQKSARRASWAMWTAIQQAEELRGGDDEPIDAEPVEQTPEREPGEGE